MIKVRMLLYYVHITTYNQINYKFPHILIIHFSRLVQFHTWRHFCTSLSIRVSNPGHPVTYARKLCTNKAGHKIYRCMSACSTRHCTLIPNPTILHTKTFLRQPITRARNYRPRQNCHSLHWYTHACLTCHRPLQNTIQTKKNLLLGLWLGLGLGLRSK